jgi:hypothetical protein
MEGNFNYIMATPSEVVTIYKTHKKDCILLNDYETVEKYSFPMYLVPIKIYQLINK